MHSSSQSNDGRHDFYHEAGFARQEVSTDGHASVSGSSTLLDSPSPRVRSSPRTRRSPRRSSQILHLGLSRHSNRTQSSLDRVASHTRQSSTPPTRVAGPARVHTVSGRLRPLRCLLKGICQRRSACLPCAPPSSRSQSLSPKMMPHSLSTCPALFALFALFAWPKCCTATVAVR